MVGSATGGGGHEFALSGNIESNVRFPAAGQGPLSRYPGCSVSQPALPEPYTDDGPPALASGSLVAGDVRFTATRQCPLSTLSGYCGGSGHCQSDRDQDEQHRKRERQSSEPIKRRSRSVSPS
jgi:hypothetical protein